MTADNETIRELELQLLKIQKQLYDSPLRNGDFKKTMSFNATSALADKIALLASTRGVTRSQLLRSIVQSYVEADEREKPKKGFSLKPRVEGSIDF